MLIKSLFHSAVYTIKACVCASSQAGGVRHNHFSEDTFMRRILFVALAALSITTPSFAATAAKKAPAATAKKKSIKPHADFHFLQFSDVAKLEFNARVKYVKAFRALIVEGETAQNTLDNSVFADLN